MKNPRTWLQAKFGEPCSCSSGRSYRQCCYRRECVYFVVGIFAALTLFGARELPQLLIVLPILLLAAFAAKLQYDRDQRRHQKRDDDSS
jgi:hypothetical protein